MVRFYAAWGAVLVGMMLVTGAALTGCCVSPPLPRDSLLLEQPPEAAPPKEVPLPRARVEPPAPPVDVSIPKPPAPRPPVVPPAVAVAIEDLSQKYPGLFVFDRATGRLRFNSDITFDSGSSVVKPGARTALTKLAQILNAAEAREHTLTVFGHTDNVPVKKADTIARLKALGKLTNNMGLSEARAESVAAVLHAGGVDAARIATQGRGETQPIADNRTAEGKSRNRRVEIFLTGPGGGRAAPPATSGSGAVR